MRPSPLVPVLWRGEGRAQAGVRVPVLLEGDDARVAAAREAAAPDAGTMLGGRTARVRGLCDTGVACLETLLTAGMGAVSLVDHPARPSQAARVSALLGWHPALRLDSERAVDVEVVVALGAVGPILRHRLRAMAAPHVAVLVDETGATVMPVIPGQTACLDCVEQHRCDADPAWPALARQCEARVPWVDPITSRLAGTLAAALALSLADRGPAGVPCARRVEAGLISPEPCAPHPECGCLT